jgi:hypothetical protein|nr:MAG TPA: hypothetical protein [Caudoviricetes sp.]
MSKINDQLQEQLKTEYKKEAEDCIRIYNKLKEISEWHVWRSNWDVLIDVTTFISNTPVYKPSRVGEIFLKGIDHGETTI